MANYITLLRTLLSFAVVGMLHVHTKWMYVAAFVLTIVLIWMDALDGYVARRLNETSTWPLLARSASGYVSSFGDLGGLSMTGSPKRLELLPYTVGDVTVQPTDGNPLIKSPSPSGEVGLDMKYALTPGLTLAATINPDFGQVEADPAVVNLSAFETFFSERRPFRRRFRNFRFDSDFRTARVMFLLAPRRTIADRPDAASDARVHRFAVRRRRFSGRGS